MVAVAWPRPFWLFDGDDGRQGTLLSYPGWWIQSFERLLESVEAAASVDVTVDVSHGYGSRSRLVRQLRLESSIDR